MPSFLRLDELVNVLKFQSSLDDISSPLVPTQYSGTEVSAPPLIRTLDGETGQLRYEQQK